jgi:hypothetical protein
MAARSALAFLLLGLMLESCAVKRSEIGLELKNAPPSLLLRLVRQERQKVRTLVGRGTLSFEAPEANGSAFFRLGLREPDSLLLRLQGPFGMSVGTFFLTRSTFVFFNAIDNSVLRGDPASRRIRSVIPFDLSGEDLLNFFGGAFPLPEDTTDLSAAVREGDLLHLTFACGDETCDYWIDPEALLVTKLRRMNARQEILLEAEAGDLREREGISLPRSIHFAFPESQRYLSVYYTALSVNGEEPSFAFSVPSSARVLRP